MFPFSFMKPGITYDWATFNLSTGQSDYDVKANQSALFDNVTVARNIIIFFNKQISIKFNSTLMPAATLPISRSPFQLPYFFLDVKNIYLTNNSGETVGVEIWLA